MYYASTSHTESTIQRPIPGTTDYMKGVISEKWMKGKSTKLWLTVHICIIFTCISYVYRTEYITIRKFLKFRLGFVLIYYIGYLLQ